MRWIVIALATLAPAMVSGCFNPTVSECAVTCSAANPCPGGASCLSDGFCHASASDSVCANGSDAGPDAPADASGPCGNGVVQVNMGEECDDNNGVSGDGCSSTCAEEMGFVCVDQPSICRPNPSAAGELVITEMMVDPSGNEFQREWFEIFNPTTTDFDLEGMFVDSGNENITVMVSLPIAAGAHIVLGRSDNLANNGGAPVDFAYGAGMSLGNSGDSLELSFGGVVIDATDWGDGQATQGASLSLSGATYDAVSNDIRGNFCDAVTAFGDGDLGTPGAMNPACI